MCNIFYDISILGYILSFLSGTYIRQEQIIERNNIRLTNHAFREAYDIYAKKSLSSRTIHLFRCFLVPCNEKSTLLRGMFLGNVHTLQLHDSPGFNVLIATLFRKFPRAFSNIKAFNISTCLLANNSSEVVAKADLRKLIIDIMSLQQSNKSRGMIWNLSKSNWYQKGVEVDCIKEIGTVTAYIEYAVLFSCSSTRQVLASLSMLPRVKNLHLVFRGDTRGGRERQHNNICYGVERLTLELGSGHASMLRSLCYDEVAKNSNTVFNTNDDVLNTVGFKNVTLLRINGAIREEYFGNIYMPNVKGLLLDGLPIRESNMHQIGAVVNRLICSAFPGLRIVTITCDLSISKEVDRECKTLLVELFSSFIEKQRELLVIVDKTMFELMQLCYDSETTLFEREYYNMGDSISDFNVLFTTSKCCKHSSLIRCKCVGVEATLFAMCRGCSTVIMDDLQPCI